MAKSFPGKMVVLLLLFWAVLTIRMAAPWYGMQTAYRVWIPAAVRNYGIYGVENIGVIVVRDSAPLDDLDDLQYYSHHPAMLAWLPAILSNFYGYHEAGVRFVFAAAMMLATAGFYVFVRRVYGERLAFPATVFFTLTPMINYFERVPGHDPLGFAVITVVAAILANWLRRPARQRLLALLLLVWLAVWTAWPAVIFVGTLGLAAMVLGKAAHRTGVVLMGLTAVIAFVALMGLFTASWPGAFDSLLEAYWWRSSSVSTVRDSAQFTMLEWLTTNLSHLIFFTTPGFVFLALIGARHTVKNSTDRGKGLLLALLLAAVVYLLVFRNASFVHDYYKAFLVPVMAITAAGAWVYLREKRASRLRKLVEILVVVTVVNAGGMLVVLHATGDQPAITAIINFINAQARQANRIVVRYEAESTDDSYERVIEFYTLRQIDWNLPPDDILEETAGQAESLLYVYCRDEDAGDFPEALAAYAVQDVYQNQCVGLLTP